jgi:discoidin domain receptor family protein 2
MCSGLYHKDYSEIGSRPPAPIRWLPWESILLVSKISFKWSSSAMLLVILRRVQMDKLNSECNIK